MSSAIPTRNALIAIVVAILAAAIVVPTGQHVFGLAANMPSFAELGSAAIEALFTFAVFGILLVIAIVGISLARGWPNLAGTSPLKMSGLGIALGLAGLFAAALYAAIAGHIRTGAGGELSLLTGTLAVAFQSATEEVYFRGWLQPLLVRAWGPIAGICTVALIFAGLHIAGGERSPVTMVNLFLGGILFGLMALRSGGIVLPIAAHFAWNWSEMMLLGLTPNPGVGSFGAIVDLDMAAAAIWGGSQEGLNASIGMSLALLALIIPLAVWRSRFSPAALPD